MKDKTAARIRKVESRIDSSGMETAARIRKVESRIDSSGMEKVVKDLSVEGRDLDSVKKAWDELWKN